MYANSADNSCNHRILQLTAVVLVALVLLPTVLAQGHEEGDQESAYTLEKGEAIKHQSLNVMLISLIVFSILIGYSILQRKALEKSNTQKIVIFSLMVVAVVGTTLYAAGSTVYLNVISETGGPVHWHADFEIWDCGKELNLIDPTGMSNRVGTPTLHEHGENRIHVEGVPIKRRDVNLQNFFYVVGGEIKRNSFVFPTNESAKNRIKMHEMKPGGYCNGEPGVLQVFVYKVTNPKDRKKWVYEQIKLTDYENYILSPEQNVPPGDCIIIEYDREKEITDKICETFKLAQDKGEIRGS